MLAKTIPAFSSRSETFPKDNKDGGFYYPINRQAKEIIDHLVFQMVKVLGVTEQLKASDQPKRNDEQYPSNGGRNRFVTTVNRA